MMSTSFLSKLTRTINILHPYKPEYLYLKEKSIFPTSITSPKQAKMGCLCSCYPSHFRCFSSSTTSSGSGSDGDGKKENSKIDLIAPLQSVMSKEKPSKEKASPCGRPAPACAALHQPDLYTTPLEEHETGTCLARRGRTQHPKKEPPPSHQPKQDKNQDVFVPNKTNQSRGRSSSRRRAKDRLETLSTKDCQRRLVFAYNMLMFVDDDPDILDNILWTDECNFNLPKLPTLITKPPVAESELLPQIAWCGLSVHGTVGPFFFNSHVTGSSQKSYRKCIDRSYLKMLENFLMPELEAKGYDLSKLWFQQDGAPWHRTKPVLDFLNTTFNKRLISLGAQLIWPPRSQDLTVMDYFFWDYMKLKLNFKHSKYDLCFQKSFREILTREVNTASLNALQGAIYQLPDRLEMCVNEHGGRFVHLLYPDRFRADGTRIERKDPHQQFSNLTKKVKSSGNVTNSGQVNSDPSNPKTKAKDQKNIIKSTQMSSIPSTNAGSGNANNDNNVSPP